MAQKITYRFRLYIAGDAHNSARAVTNLAALCARHLAGRNQVEIVDVFREPTRALAEGVFMTPMLLKLSPSPVRRIVGSLSQEQPLLQALDLDGQPL